MIQQLKKPLRHLKRQLRKNKNRVKGYLPPPRLWRTGETRGTNDETRNMRGIFKRKRAKLFTSCILGLVLCLYACSFYSPFWMKKLIEDKVSEFLGDKLTVRIGEVSGGFFDDMMLKNIVIFPAKGKGGNVFRFKKMEISYRVWWAAMERIGLMSAEETALKYLGMYFSSENPFVIGDLKLYRRSDKVELIGRIVPVLFGDNRVRELRGDFYKNEEGEYDCNLIWDKDLKITGRLDPSMQNIELGFNPLEEKKGIVKVSGGIDESKDVKVYTRLDKVDVFGAEIIGDLWLSYSDHGTPVFNIKAENLVINKKPFWDISAEGGFSAKERRVYLDYVSWGQGLFLRGYVGVDKPYDLDLELSIRDFELHKIPEITGDSRTQFFGKMEGDVHFEGPAEAVSVKGRLYVGEGFIGGLEFTSISAELKGKWPTVSIVDSRIIKDTGQISVSGDMDFSKFFENKTFGDIKFETDNKVAFWEDWQISKEVDTNKVEATRDRVTVSTSYEDESFKFENEEDINRDIGFKYKLDTTNSIKFEIEENDDFFGLEHKIQF